MAGLANMPQIVQGSRVALGIDLQQASFLIIPGSSDYVTGGYVLTAQMLTFKGIQSAWVSGANATAIAGWVAVPVFAFAQLGLSASPGAGFTGYSQFLLYVYVVTTGAQNSANLAGAIWQLTVQGY